MSWLAHIVHHTKFWTQVILREATVLEQMFQLYYKTIVNFMIIHLEIKNGEKGTLRKKAPSLSTTFLKL